MARVSSKHGRDQPLDFQGFLNDLQEWEMSNGDKEKKLKSQGHVKENLVSSGSSTKPPSSSTSKASGLYDFSRTYDSSRHLSSSFITEECSPDATSEKELGNEYFKQKKFKEAADCYSRSIAFSPTAVAYANRAMAYLKLKRYKEAEDDCTEALNLDDRYIKAYSRRSTARKELGKLKESVEDADFAMRLEPQNQEIKKQHAEAKSLYDKMMLKKVAGSLNSPIPGEKKVRKGPVEINGCQSHHDGVQPVSSSSQKTGSTALKEDLNERSHKKQELNSSVQELAARAASLAKVEAAKNIAPPKSAFQFEVSWRGLADDRTLQAQLLKVTSPSALPEIFKDALSVPLLMDIIRCISTFFLDNTDLAVKYLENLTEVSRFDILIMCLSSSDRAEVDKIWEEVFCGNAIPVEYAERLDKLRPKYSRKQ